MRAAPLFNYHISVTIIKYNGLSNEWNMFNRSAFILGLVNGEDICSYKEVKNHVIYGNKNLISILEENRHLDDKLSNKYLAV